MAVGWSAQRISTNLARALLTNVVPPAAARSGASAGARAGRSCANARTASTGKPHAAATAAPPPVPLSNATRGRPVMATTTPTPISVAHSSTASL